MSAPADSSAAPWDSFTPGEPWAWKAETVRGHALSMHERNAAFAKHADIVVVIAVAAWIVVALWRRLTQSG